jgi:hypothetical protein
MTSEEHFRAFEEVDLRIQRKHEALAETVEIIAGMQRENERQIGELATKMNTLTERTIQAMETINRLGNIIIDHEERLDNIEGK